MTRHGKTLVELLVVISVFGAIMAPIGRLLHTIMRSEREGAHALAASTIGSRLAREFRSDVRSARDVELQGDKGELGLTLDDGKAVTYRPGEEGLQRTMTEGDQTLSRDSFRLPPGTTRFEISDEPPLVMVQAVW